MDEVVHIAIPVDGKYRKYAEVTVASARRGSSLPIEVHYIDWSVINRGRLESLGSWHGSAIAFSRLYLAELFPDLDWIITCDADVLFRGDVAELWKLRDDAVAFIAHKDCPLPPHPYTRSHYDWYKEHGFVIKDWTSYFADGLGLVNLKRWREKGYQDEFERLAKAYDDWPSPDMMILNYVLQDDKKLLPVEWDCFSGDENADVDWSKSGAVHFVEDPPWNRYKITHLASDLVEEWWHVAKCNGIKITGRGYHGCRNWLDWVWRRCLFVLLKNNQWMVRWNRRLYLHFRSTRGVSANCVLCARQEVNSAMAQRVRHLQSMISNKCQVVVSCHTGVVQNVLAVLEARLKGRRIVKEICDWPLSVIWGESRLKQWIEVHVLPKIFDGAICMTDVLVDFWIQHGRKGCPIFKLPMTVDVQEVDKVGKDDAHLIPYVCYAGGLSEEKDGVETLKKSFEIVRSKLASNMPNLQLKILNGMSHYDVLREMKSAACLVLARPDSLQARAGFPTKLGEYLSTGRPVVVTKVGEIPQFLEDGISAFLVDAPDDRNILAVNVAEKMIQVLTHPEQAEVVGARGRLVAKKCFDWHVHAKELNAWLERFDSREKKKDEP